MSDQTSDSVDTPETMAEESAPKAANPAALKPSKPKGRLATSSGDDRRASDRRQQQRRMVIMSFLGMGLASAFAAAKFFFPRVLFEPKTKFRVGYPSEYGFGVDTRWQSTQRIWIVRNGQGLFVINAVCTHLGCTPDWKATENKFKCPCHGSGYTMEGINFEGPAPRPLDRCSLELDAEGQVVVDKLRLYKYEEFDKSILAV